MVNKTRKLIELICGKNPSDACALTITQLVKTMEQTCAQCQADRKFVLLDPLCKDRFYLSLLVEAGVPYSEYPLDCYKIRLEEVKKLIQGKPTPVAVVDAVVRLRDFLKVLIDALNLSVSKRKLSAIKSTDKLIDFVREIVENNEDLHLWLWNKKAYLVIRKASEVVINLLDFEKDIAYVNLYERPIRTENLEHIVKHMFAIFGIEGNLYASPTGNLYIRVPLSKQNIRLNSNDIRFRLIQESEGKSTLTINVRDTRGSNLRYKELIEVLRMVGGES